MPALTVVTLNILRKQARWSERRALLAQGLAQQNADLIALQEVALPDNTAYPSDHLGLAATLELSP